MTTDQLKQLEKALKESLHETVKITINGKIDALNKKVDAYIVEDNAWKVRAEPAVNAFQNGTFLFKTGVSVAKFVGFLGGVLLTIYGVFEAYIHIRFK